MNSPKLNESIDGISEETYFYVGISACAGITSFILFVSTIISYINSAVISLISNKSAIKVSIITLILIMK